jgi:hypothetical protein
MTIERKDLLSKRKELWIGLAHVRQFDRGGILGDADQAYVNVIAIALNKSDFRTQLKKALDEIDLGLIKLEDAETMEVRLSKNSIHEDLHKLAEEAERTGVIRFDIFQTFDA